jgi:predicted dithiol-disulfide oxidoreductase (DUF899 family)
VLVVWIAAAGGALSEEYVMTLASHRMSSCSKGRVFARCGCRDETGKQLGASCPLLGSTGHGSWTFQVRVAGFLRDGDAVARTYYTRGRGVDRLKFDANMFDLTPLGRQQDWEEPSDADPHTQARFDIAPATSGPRSS